MLEITFMDMLLIGIVLLLILAFGLTLRIQRIRLMRMNMITKHEMDKLESSLEGVKKTLPEFVDREKLALEKEGLEREISALSNKLSQEGKRVEKLDKEIANDKKADRVLLRSVSKVETKLEKLKEKLKPRKKVKKVKKAKPARKKRK